MSVTLDACSIILEELRALSKKVDALSERLPASRKRKEREPAQICSGKTAKGQPCNHRALAGSEFCKMHDPERKATTTTSKPPPAPRLVKIEPAHTHAPDEEPPEGGCDLCETKGNPILVSVKEESIDENEDEDEDVENYINDAETNERLKALLSEQDL